MSLDLIILSFAVLPDAAVDEHNISTQTVTALAGNTAALVNFTWTPTILEDVNITATTSAIDGETLTINNTVSQPGNVNNNLFSYNYSLAGQSGLGYDYPNGGISAVVSNGDLR